MTLTINLSDLLHLYKMFQVAHAGEKKRCKSTRICHDVWTMSTRYSFRQTQNGEIVEIHAFHLLYNFVALE